MTTFDVATALSLGFGVVTTDKIPMSSHKMKTPKKEPQSLENGDQGFDGERSTKSKSYDHQFEELKEEVERISEENKRLNKAFVTMQQDYVALQTQVVQILRKSPTIEVSLSPSSSSSPLPSMGKRKVGELDQGSNIDWVGSYGKQREEEEVKVRKAYVKTNPMDASLTVKDGYQWRKYGQKATGRNKMPRAYFRCSFYPRCAIKKKVQRSTEDSSILIVTYEGEHTHPKPSVEEVILDPHDTHKSFGKMPLDVPRAGLPNQGDDRQESLNSLDHNEEEIADRLASCLSKDPNFAEVLAAAICERIQLC